MPITNQQDIPNKPKISEPWTFKQIFSVAGVISTALKQFTVLQLFAAFALAVAAVGELTGRPVSIFWYIILLVILGGIFFFDYKNILKEKI